MSFLRPFGSKRQSRADRLALKSVLKQVAYSLIPFIIIGCIGHGQSFQADADALGTLAKQQVYMVGHEAVGIHMAVRRYMFAIVIHRIHEELQAVEELLIVLLFLKDVLAVDAAHHHMMDACA